LGGALHVIPRAKTTNVCAAARLALNRHAASSGIKALDKEKSRSSSGFFVDIFYWFKRAAF
jgi:hypothetical protein